MTQDPTTQAVPPGRGGAAADVAFTGSVYAAWTGHHRAHDETVLGPVPWRAGMHVLDVGCGVGDLTSTIADLVEVGASETAGQVLGVDVSASQIELATSRHARPGLRFEVARAQELQQAVTPGWADVVITVATLHWVVEQDQPAVLAGLAAALKPGGLLRVDMGGAGQIADTRTVLDGVAAEHGIPLAPWFYPTPELFTSLLEVAGLVPDRVQLLRQERRMADAEALEGWLRSQVLPGYLRGSDPTSAPAEAFTVAAVERCLASVRRADGSYSQDYVRLDALAHRP